MKRNFIFRCIVMLALVATGTVSGKELKPMDAFIMRVKETNAFVPVSNLWQPDNNFDKTTMLKSVEHAQPLTIDYANIAAFMRQKSTAISLIVPGIDGGTFTIDLARYDYFTNSFQVHEMGANNTDKQVDYTPGLYYSGVVNGIEGSIAAFSFFNNEVYGTFSIPGVGNYVLVPNTQVGEYYNYNQHYILYNDRELTIRPDGPVCSTDKLHDIQRPVSKTTTTLNNNIYNNCTEVRCFETADNAMYVKKGTSTTNCTNYLTALFNNKATIYRNEGVLIVLNYVQINTATDPYATLPTSSTSSVRWLDKFGWVTQTTMHGSDVATLFTTKGGSMGGVAWVQIMCGGYYAADSAGPYAFCNINNSSTTTSTAFPTYSWDVEVSTHEMGHVVGSPHTHGCYWNPPARNTAIDGCYTIEGSCANPGNPSAAVGGTIMSYCHLTSSGINFSNGFGPQPGDTIRRFIRNTVSPSTCGFIYTPSVALSKAGRTITANRECTDPTGTTYYWKDNNTADQTDDTLVLMMVKGTNNIGTMNTTGFTISATALAGYGGGTGATATFPTGVSGLLLHNIAMNRYWTIAGTTTPTSAVEVIFPFMLADTTDVDGSVPGIPALIDYRMYKVNSPVSPDPSAGFSGAVASNFSMYTHATAAGTTNWSFTTSGTTNFAHLKMSNLNGGGSMFYSYNTAAVSGIGEISAPTGVFVYPNPTHDQWFVSVAKNNNEVMTFQLFTADGRMVQTKILENSAVNTVSAADLPTGLYFYRVVGSGNIYTGNLIKK